MTELTDLTEEQLEELRALAAVNFYTQGPSFMMRSHWRGLYQPLVQRGLVAWGDPPEGFDKRQFAGTMVTEAGRAILRPHGAPSP